MVYLPGVVEWTLHARAIVTGNRVVGPCPCPFPVITLSAECRYRAPDLHLYVDMPLEDGKEVVELLRCDLPLIEQLVSKQVAEKTLPCGVSVSLAPPTAVDASFSLPR